MPSKIVSMSILCASVACTGSTGTQDPLEIIAYDGPLAGGLDPFPASVPARFKVSSVKTGPVIGGLVDAAPWADSVAALDRYGLIWLLDASGRVGRVISVGQALGVTPVSPLSILVGDSMFGVWDAASAAVWWVSPDGRGGYIDTALVDRSGLYLGAQRPLDPPRMHGRSAIRDQVRYVEARRRSDSAGVGGAEGLLIRIVRSAADTVLRFPASGYARAYGGAWICCERVPLFAPQPWWAVLADSTIAFADGAEPALCLFSDRGSMVARVRWRLKPVDVTKSGVQSYWYTFHRVMFRDSSAQFLRARNGQVADRADALLAAVSRTVPSLTQMLVDGQSRLWLRRFDPRRWPHGLSAMWDVFDANLRYRGVVDTGTVQHVFYVGDSTIVGANVVGSSLYRIVIARMVRT